MYMDDEYLKKYYIPNPSFGKKTVNKRIHDTIAYLDCGVVHEYEIIKGILKGEKYEN